MPIAVSPQALSEEDRFLLAREELLARLTAELSPERISILSRGELAKVVDAAIQAHFVRKGVEADPIVRRNLITALIKGLLEPDKTHAGAAGLEDGARHFRRGGDIHMFEDERLDLRLCRLDRRLVGPPRAPIVS